MVFGRERLQQPPRPALAGELVFTVRRSRGTRPSFGSTYGGCVNRKKKHHADDGFLLPSAAPHLPNFLSGGCPIEPYSVLSAREGVWQDRKRAWMSVGIKSEIGRKGGLLFSDDQSVQKFDYYRVASGMKPTTQAQGTSIFDPVLCECLYRWFCPPNGQVVDPFAGGSVRGIVAGMLSRKYWGSDLSADQINANREQAKTIAPPVMPTWVCGDSNVMLADAPSADFVMSCPPYGNLEVYSKDKSDLSAMPNAEFLKMYRSIIGKAVAKLKPDSFAAFVVGDYRDDAGYYQDFVSETILAFKNAGCRLYNEIILVTVVGSASMRITRQFSAGRKFCKIHQNVLVFCKSDWQRAAAKLGAP